MPKITVYFKDKTTKVFPEEVRPGGSYSNVLECRDGFVLITDVWGKLIAFPDYHVEYVEQEAPRRW